MLIEMHQEHCRLVLPMQSTQPRLWAEICFRSQYVHRFYVSGVVLSVKPYCLDAPHVNWFRPTVSYDAVTGMATASN